MKVPVVVPSSPIPTDVGMIEGRVVVVYDGDNLSLQGSDGKVYSVRLLAIDAPELDQSYGKKAKKKLEDLVLDKNVRVIIHRKDSFDRYIGTVFFNGRDIGIDQLENGYAWHYTRFSGEQAADMRDRYARAELKARKNHDGLWSEDAPVPPWEFRDDKNPEAKTSVAETPVQTLKSSAVETPAATTPGPTDTEKAKSTEEAVPGRVYTLGPRGGCYYLNASGSKVYVKNKSLCNAKPQ